MNAFDVVVVGAGIAGLVAGVRCAEGGLSVAVLERGDGDQYPCNTRLARGAFHLVRQKVTADPARLKTGILEVTGGFATPAWVDNLAENSRHAVVWLKRQGVRFIKGGAEDWAENFLAPPTPIRTGLNWQGRGPDVMLRTLRVRLENLGGVLLLGHRAIALRMDGDRCVGVEVENNGPIKGQHVVLCDGGFQGDIDLLRRFVSPQPEMLLQRGASTGTGDALRMALAEGASTIGMDSFYGHVLSQEAFQNPRLWPYPTIDLVCNAAILVDGHGRRFADEGIGGVYLANQIARLTDPCSATVIFDHTIWETAATDFMLPPNPHLVLAGGRIDRAETLIGLAEQLGFDVDGFGDTIEGYNVALQSGTLSMLIPARTTTKFKAMPIVRPPFYALRVCAGITYTMGGLKVDDRGRVLKQGFDAIPGLYASGCTAGGIEGGEKSGYVSGLTKCATTSLTVAGEILAIEHAQAATHIKQL